MTSRYRVAKETIEKQIYEGWTCNGCGDDFSVHENPIKVIISVHDGEEGGGFDCLDFCDPCLDERAPTLALAGSTAPLIVGHPDGDESVPEDGDGG